MFRTTSKPTTRKIYSQLGSSDYVESSLTFDSWCRIPELKIISLFSGAGGLDEGFIRAGHRVVWANDTDADAVKTYRENIGDHIVLGDIADIDPSQIPDADLVMGGIPCQGFSYANIHRVSHDQRNNLYLQFARVVENKEPSFFLIENVRGMLSLDHGKAFRQLLKYLEQTGSQGYDTEYKVLNAADYGVPQNRMRVFLVGVRRDLSLEHRYQFPIPTHSKKADESGLLPWISIGETLGSVPEPEDTHDLLNHVASAYKVTNRNFTGHRTTDPNKPSPTILARGDGRGGVCAIQHPKNHRRLTVRESAIIQTFSNDFKFSGKLMSMYRQAGNAVPVLLAEHVAAGFESRSKVV